LPILLNRNTFGASLKEPPARVRKNNRMVNNCGQNYAKNNRPLILPFDVAAKASFIVAYHG